MASSKPLLGIELIDCAKANAKQGIEIAAKLCGYGEDISAFERELKQAGQNTGISIDSLSDLITEPQVIKKGRGVSIAPDSESNL